MKRLLAASLALAATALAVAGCSSSSSTDPIFPAVHDMPAPRPETPLTADQVKAATDDLITQREHLSTEVQTASHPAPPAKIADTKTANTKTLPPKKPPVVPQAAPDTTATAPPAAPAPEGQTAGAYSKQ